MQWTLFTLFNIHGVHSILCQLRVGIISKNKVPEYSAEIQRVVSVDKYSTYRHTHNNYCIIQPASKG